MITTDEAIIRRKCEPVKPEEVDGLISLLEEDLEKSNTKGIGLAANQIGIHKSIAIVRINENIKINLVNCRIEEFLDEFIFEDEGCLSIPDLRTNTKRYNEIYVVDNLVYPHSFVATGLAGVCIQHELDHLNGITIKDRAVKLIPKQEPNDKCICGSGKKYKKCCYLKR